MDAGLGDGVKAPPPPWFPIQGTRDASTMWYAVMIKQTRGIFIGTICLRHSGHHASLSQAGWHEVPVPEIGVKMRSGVRR